MSFYADTSYFCAFYGRNVNTARAAEYLSEITPPLRITWLLEFEFTNGVRCEAFRNSCDRNRGYSLGEATAMLVDFENDVATGLIEIVEFDSVEVRRIAEELSEKYSTGGGHRSFDILHVATAIHFGASEFLTFDANQRKIAAAAGLKVPV